MITELLLAATLVVTPVQADPPQPTMCERAQQVLMQTDMICTFVGARAGEQVHQYECVRRDGKEFKILVGGAT